MKYAVVKNGRNQMLLKEGDTVLVDAHGLTPGQDYQWDGVLMVRDGDELKIGKPVLDNVTVTGKVLSPTRGPKVVNFKKKRRKGYTRKVGHRQDFTKIKVEEIK